MYRTAGLGCLPGITHLALPRLQADVTVAAPRHVDLRPRPQTPPIGDQKNLGSCTAWAVEALARYVYSLLGYRHNYQGSALFIYFNERLLMHTVQSDSGASIDTALEAMTKYGRPDEHWWPYDVGMFALVPTQDAYRNAVKHTAHTTLVVDPVALAIKQSVAQGYPVDFGFAVYASFLSGETAATGKVRIPSASEDFEGGHSCCIWGYDDDLMVYDQVGAWIVRNQWGAQWGDQGYFYLPYEYTQHNRLAWDFRTIRQQS